MRNEKFTKDREDFSGSKWDSETRERSWPENILGIKEAFELLEGLFADGRNWAGGNEGPGMTDIEGMLSMMPSHSF